MRQRRKARKAGRSEEPTIDVRAAREGIDPIPRGRPKILFVTTEFADYVKAGGLGEVSAALPRALRSQCDIRVLIPGYRDVVNRLSAIELVGHLTSCADVPACDLARSKTRDGLAVYVLLCPQLFDREGGPYSDATGTDWADNDLRFARLSLAAAQMASGAGDPNWIPDLLHLNDWTSALAPAYLAWSGRPTPSVLTIHNLAHRGLFSPHHVDRLGIPHAAFDINGVEFCGDISFLKAGIFYASHVTTVSSTYAREIVTPEHGCGLHGLLRGRLDEGRLTGIINGIDDSWDPLTDPHLVQPFSSDDCKGKDVNAQALRRTFGLAVSRGPLFAIVSRLVHQKGLPDAGRKRLSADALALRAMRADADVRATLRLVACGTSNRRASRYDSGRCHGRAFRRTLAWWPFASNLPLAGHLSFACAAEGHAQGRDGPPRRLE